MEDRLFVEDFVRFGAYWYLMDRETHRNWWVRLREEQIQAVLDIGDGMFEEEFADYQRNEAARHRHRFGKEVDEMLLDNLIERESQGAMEGLLASL
jgi:hypothetical protein